MKPHRIVVAARARTAIDRVAAWWKANRIAAPHVFAAELGAAFELISNTPAAGEVWPSRKVPHVRRCLLKKTRYHVNYAVDDAAAAVTILMVWYSGRGRGPKL